MILTHSAPGKSFIYGGRALKIVQTFFLATLFIAAIIYPACSQAEAAARVDTPAQKTGAEKAPLIKTTETGLFNISLAVTGESLVTGTNALDLVIRDKQGAKVNGAEVTVTPWMPKHGHGVWEKPEVTERGDGNYHAKNVEITGDGLWDIRVAVTKGQNKGTAVFSFAVDSTSAAAAKSAPKYLRTVEYYRVPNVTLLDQDGKPVKLRSFLDSDKPVIIEFMFTTCTTVCPILSAGFKNLREGLGKDSKSVHFVSITIDPEHDRPEQMKAYLTRFDAGDEWDFLTGSREDITLVLKAFDASVVDKMSHNPLYIMRGPKADEWVRIKGLIGQSDFMSELQRIRNK
jgi:protein SCO1/2